MNEWEINTAEYDTALTRPPDSTATKTKNRGAQKLYHVIAEQYAKLCLPS